MNEDKKAVLKKYLICLCVGIVIAFFVLALKEFSMKLDVLCDAFSTAGLLMILIAGLMFISGEGGFLGIGYAMSRVLRVFFPMPTQKIETYAEYRERKTGEKKSKGEGCLFFTGLFYLLIGVILMIIWMQI